jgi:hypothetical protein
LYDCVWCVCFGSKTEPCQQTNGLDSLGIVKRLHQSVLRGGLSKLQRTAPPKAAGGGTPKLPQPPQSASAGSGSSSSDARPEAPEPEDKLAALGRWREKILYQLGAAAAQREPVLPPRTTVDSGRPEHNGRGQLRSEVSGIAMHGGGWSAVVRFTDADFRHQLLGSKPGLLTQGVLGVPQDPLDPD